MIITIENGSVKLALVAKKGRRIINSVIHP